MPLLGIDVEARIAQALDAFTKLERRGAQSAANMQKAFGALKGVLGTLGVGLGVGAFSAMIKGAVDAQDKLQDLAKTTGLSVETIGGIGFAAKQSGGSLDELAKGYSKFNLAVAKAKGGNEELLQVFKNLGVSQRDLAKLDTQEIFFKVADAFAATEDGAEKAEHAQKLFSKGFASMIPLLDEGSASIRANIAYFEKYSGITAESAKKADEFNDQLDKFNLVLGGLKQQLTGELLGPMKEFVDALTRVAEEGHNARVVIDLFRGSLELLGRTLDSFQNLGSIFISGKQFDEPALAVEEIERKLVTLRSTLNSLSGNWLKNAFNADDIAIVRTQIALLEGQLVTLSARAAARELGVPEGHPSSHTPATPERQKGRLPTLQDSGAKNKAEAEAKAFEEAMARLQENRAKRALDNTKFLFDTELQILERSHAAALVGEQQYWNQREQIQERAFQAELADARAGVAARQALVDRPQTGATKADIVKNRQALE